MNDKQWSAWLATTARRLKERLRAIESVQRGDTSLRRVEVKPYRVRAYTVGAHVRYIVPSKRSRKAAR